MWVQILSILCLVIVATPGISANGKCELLPPNNQRSIVYSCVEVNFEQLREVSVEAEWIQLSVSKLYIPDKGFARFSLRGLSFYNCDIREIQAGAFEGLHRLERLTFYGTDIRVVKASWFKRLTRLTHLSLEKNKIMYIEPNVFHQVPNLELLNIEDNNLNCLSEHALAPLRHLKHMKMGKNPWLCSCHAELITWLKNKQILSDADDLRKVKFECIADCDVQCSQNGWKTYFYKHSVESTEESHGVYTSTKTSDEKYIKMISNGQPLSCMGNTLSALVDVPDNVQSITLSGLQIDSIPDFAFFQFGNSLKVLNLSNCNINEIRAEAFMGLFKLQKLILVNNKIKTVRAEWFRDLRKLKHLDLDHNKIEYINASVFPYLDKLSNLSLNDNQMQCLSTESFSFLKNLKRVNILDNPWRCSCQQGFVSWLNQKQIGYDLVPKKCTNGQNVVQTTDAVFGQSLTSGKTEAGNEGSVDHQAGLKEKHYHTEEITKNEQFTRHEVYFNTTKQQQQYNRRRRRDEDCQSNNWQVTTPAPQNQGTNLCPPTCRRIHSSFLRVAYACSGGTLSGLNRVPANAESIQFEYATIRVITDYVFTRFAGSLRILEFKNCLIQNIQPQAFAKLINLQQLTLTHNYIREVQRSWFESTVNLQRLNLTHNSIMRIDNNIYKFLPNLRYFGIADNQLNCIGQELLSNMSKLTIVDVGNNPLSCLCRARLIEWMESHHVNYDRHNFQTLPGFGCIDPSYTPHPGTAEPTIVPTGPINPTYPPPPPTSPTVPIPDTTAIPPPTIPKPMNPAIKCTYDLWNTTKERLCVCSGTDVTLYFDQIPIDVERIEIINSTIRHLATDVFARFKHLKQLVFHNCTIPSIDPFAFRGLYNLEFLEFRHNSMTTIQSSWFYNMTSLTELHIRGNSVTEIEADAFEYLPNLKVFTLRDTGVQCIYTSSLSSLKKLQNVSFESNPWKWRCHEELVQFLDMRNVTYTKFDTYQGKQITCESISQEIGAPHSIRVDTDNGATNTSISTVNVLCVSLAMLIFTKF